MITYLTTLPSPVGTLTLAADGTALTGLWLEGQKYFRRWPSGYCTGKRLVSFSGGRSLAEGLLCQGPPSLPCRRWRPRAVPSARRCGSSCWRFPTAPSLLTVPCPRSSGTGASPLRPRPWAAPWGHNPISILIPCHRVVGSDGSLTGYAGGVAKKQFLLELEGVDMAGLYVPTRGTAL